MSEEAAYALPEPVLHCHVVVDDATGEVLECSRAVLDPGVDPILAPLPAGQSRYAVSSAVYEQVRTGRPHRLENGELVPFVRVQSIERLRAFALEQVDIQAERARLKFISPGSGQALEYQATEFEAREFLAAPTLDLAGYPFLEAEVDAIHETTGIRPDPAVVAQTVVAQASAWHVAGSTIKRLRRAAKLAINAATTKEEIDFAADIAWPEPTLA